MEVPLWICTKEMRELFLFVEGFKTVEIFRRMQGSIW